MKRMFVSRPIVAGLIGVAVLVGAVAQMTGPVAAQTTTQPQNTTPPSSATTSTTSTTTTTRPSPTTATPTTATPTTAATTTTLAPTTLPARVPDAPQNVAATLSGTAQITVTWQPPTPNGGPAVTSYTIIEVAISGSSSSTSPPVVVAAPSTSKVFIDRRPGLSYAYYVRAVNATGEGANSPYTSPVLVPAPTTQAAPPPAAPANPTLTYVGNGQLRVNFSPPQSSPSPIASYRVLTTPSIGSVNLSATTFQVTFKGARAGVAYLAQIASVSPSGVLSAFAVTNTVTIPLPATTPPLPATAPPQTAPPAPNSGKPLPVQPPTPPGRPRPCVSVKWPASVYGRPSTFTTGAPQGVYVWHDGKYWQVRFYNPGPGPVVFTGSITANTRVNFYGAGNDRGDVLRRGRTSATFSLTSDYDIDGIRISASCATALTFNFFVNGQPVPPQRIYVGKSSTASGSTFSIVR
jgi:Fibronectin type III domain